MSMRVKPAGRPHPPHLPVVMVAQVASAKPEPFLPFPKDSQLPQLRWPPNPTIPKVPGARL